MSNYPVRRLGLAGVVLGIALTTGACGARQVPTVGNQPAAAPNTTPVATVPPSPPAPRPEPAPGPDVPSTIDPTILVNAAAVEPNTTLGAVVFDRATGTELLHTNADRQFRSASLVKLMIAIDALTRGADEGDRQRLAKMLSASDDNLASSFWVQGGRPEIVARTVAALGLTGTEPPENPGKWGEVRLTAHDMMHIYQHVLTELPPADRTLIVNALTEAPEFAADGFDQHFGIPDGLPVQWAIKQGWGNNSSAMVLHSTGLVGPDLRYIVILLTEHPLGSGWRTSADSVTAAAAALHGQLPGV